MFRAWINKVAGAFGTNQIRQTPTTRIRITYTETDHLKTKRKESFT